MNAATAAQKEYVRFSDARLIDGDYVVALSTDCGGDIDDTLAAITAALTLPQLKLVITADELHGGLRARWARWVLDLCGRRDVQVVAGHELGGEPLWSAYGLVPDHVAPQTQTLLDAMDRIWATGRRLLWVGLGPMTDLHYLLQERPEWVERLQVTQMGGAIHLPRERAEHNLRLDPDAARAVLAQVTDLRLVSLDVTKNPRIAIDRSHPLYQQIATSTAPWASPLHTHMTQWFDDFHEPSHPHDVVALGAALGLFVEFERDGLVIDDDGRTFRGPGGREALVAVSADYDRILSWLGKSLTGGGGSSR